MQPTINIADVVLVNGLAYVKEEPQRGDIVVFDGTEGDMAGQTLVKRIIGLPGDSIMFVDGYIYINGEFYNEEYIDDDVETNSFKDFEVPEDCYFVLGYMTDYIDEFKALGYLRADYGSPTTTSSAETATSQPAEPEAFTVEEYTPAKTMWATSIVNCRSGASTSYAKVGSLTANGEVSVSGVASTGWYEITEEDGTKVYVSNKYLTDVNPNAEMETTEEIVPETTETVTEEVTAEETAVTEAVEEPFTLEETIEEPESIVESENIEETDIP